MAEQAPDWFTTQYAQRAMNIYQNRGFKLKGMVTNGGRIEGSDRMRFFIAGTSTAQERFAGNQRLIPTGGTRTHVDALLRDWYVYDTSDIYNLERMSVDERESIYENGAMAIGRATDKAIYGTMAAAINAQNGGDFSAGAFSAANAMTLCAQLQQDNVDWDGNVYCGLPPLQWNQLLANKVVNSSDHVGADNLPFINSTDSRRWNGVNWFLLNEQNALDLYPVPSANKQDLFIWHKSAIGWGTNTDLETQTPQWIGVEQHWDIISVARGACAVLQNGKGIKRFTTSTNSAITIV